ncbi:VP26 [Suid alphaherpesvirus 1]|uniref:Small capsomere-interacting protein n=1 Tax=Suid herpesvirus 1 TaxID=10345 RepID=G3G8R4_SUHV|nr:Chain E, Small capsomere-interacting protein [Suid alphaherpesvirus 1]7FJ1_F Chain F, Small capsomere-interacting protein [Suid alphaherpesvirus 1]7FJ1_G Chain G, Small capsomere-interacting protein [Suid alphaherpesvirus 1]7FJ1_H Chain H, Small capsomere-interacting protein [Suid alphaherpesvirus 1]7FJ1_I Chain I, Small capsomere-interacting protein [Suid alphaherpesvirus 1]7FJ1_J Chain J, Small capsomere-interacting protein [Suid alphaherpesvirus 1]7FJ1_K Chain K, Small capsomere-interac
MSFDPNNPRTITAQTLEGALPVDILLRLNRATGLQMDAAEAHAIVEDARRTLFIGTSLALVNLRRAHDKHLVERQPMFATSDYSSWARPTVGLKRTFCPRPPP